MAPRRPRSQRLAQRSSRRIGHDGEPGIQHHGRGQPHRHCLWRSDSKLVPEERSVLLPGRTARPEQLDPAEPSVWHRLDAVPKWFCRVCFREPRCIRRRQDREEPIRSDAKRSVDERHSAVSWAPLNAVAHRHSICRPIRFAGSPSEPCRRQHRQSGLRCS